MPLQGLDLLFRTGQTPLSDVLSKRGIAQDQQRKDNTFRTGQERSLNMFRRGQLQQQRAELEERKEDNQLRQMGAAIENAIGVEKSKLQREFMGRVLQREIPDIPDKEISRVYDEAQKAMMKCESQLASQNITREQCLRNSRAIIESAGRELQRLGSVTGDIEAEAAGLERMGELISGELESEQDLQTTIAAEDRKEQADIRAEGREAGRDAAGHPTAALATSQLNAIKADPSFQKNLQLQSVVASAEAGIATGGLTGELLAEQMKLVGKAQTTGVTSQLTGGLSPSSNSKIEEDLRSSQTRFNRVAESLTAFDPRFLQVEGALVGGVIKGLDRMGFSTSAEQKDFTARREAFFRQAEDTFLRIRKDITGVAGGEKEAGDIRLANPSSESGPIGFLAKGLALLATEANVQRELVAFQQANDRKPTQLEGHGLLERANVSTRADAPVEIRILAPELMLREEIAELLQNPEFFDSQPEAIRKRVLDRARELRGQ